MVDAFHLESLALDELGSIIGDCQGLIVNSYFSIQFGKR